MAKKKSEKAKPKKKELSKEKSNMSDQPLRILGVSIHRAPPATATAPATLNLGVDVENPGNQPLYVWASCKEYSYDPATHVLSVDLAEPTRQLPSYIKMISDHPRAPAQVVVNPKSRATIKVLVPGKVNRPGPPGGPAWVEDPIGQIDRVQIRVQNAAEPIQHRAGESPTAFRQRLREHGETVQAEVTPSAEKEK
jgi:hypothetical protein